MRKSSIAKGLAGALAILTFGASGCSHEPQPTGQLMLAIQTDMALPKDVDQVTIQILSGGVVRFNQAYPAGAGGLLVPATLGIVAGDNPSTPVTVRVIARQAGVARVLREAVSTIPTHRSATLRVPIQWLCDGSAKDDPSSGPNDPDRDLKVQSTCPPGQTCRAGQCVPTTISDSELSTFDDGEVFGGASAGEGSCFDTLGCFAQGFGSDVEFTTCSIEKPSGGTGVNVALVKPLGTDGICGPDSCLVPLDGESESGWRSVGNRIVLPRAVCDRIISGSVLSVAVTTSCATKGESSPTCGPWSSVTGTSSNDAPGPSNGGVPPVAPPPPTPGSPPGDNKGDLVLAIRKLDFDHGDAQNGWSKIGYNLDHKVTLPDAKDVCQPVDPNYPGAAFEGHDSQSDGTIIVNGIDNAFGIGVVAALNSLQADWKDQLNQAITAGDQTLLLSLGKVKDQNNYLGLQGALFTGAGFCDEAAGGADAGAGDAGCGTPHFDGKDVWPIAGESVIGGDRTKPRVVFPSAYMTGRYWVSGTQPAEVALTLTIQHQPLTLHIHKAYVTVKVSQDGTGTDGVLAGVLDTEEFLASLKKVVVGYGGQCYCDDAKFEKDVGDTVRAFSDILSDGTQDPSKTCDGISFGVAFEAKPVQLGGVTLPGAAPGDACAGFDPKTCPPP